MAPAPVNGTSEAPLEYDREIKATDEIVMMNHAISVCEAAMAPMRGELEADMTENGLWAILNHVNASMGAEWIETKLLSSGGRTKPWYQETSDRVIRAGDPSPLHRTAWCR